MWMSLKGSVMTNKAHVILDEIESREDLSLKIYGEALPFILQPELRAVVEKQLASIQESHARIRTLRDETAPPPPPTPVEPVRATAPPAQVEAPVGKS